MEIPAVCKPAYEAKAKTRIGVIDFSMHSKIVAPAGWRWWREVEMKLPEIVADGVIDELVNIGGAKVFTRTEIGKVLEEQRFQMSEYVDDKTLVKIGRLVGLEYIITGAINDIGISRTGFVGAAGAAITTDITVRMLDVTTGEILLSKKVSGRHILDSTNYIGITSAIKKASSKSIEDIRPEFSKRFTPKGYILQTRTSPDGKLRCAIINMGEAHGLKPGLKLTIYTFQEIKDPFTGKSTCAMVKIPVKAVVTEQIQKDKAWVLISGDINQVRRIRRGALVERAPIKGQDFLRRLGL